MLPKKFITIFYCCFWLDPDPYNCSPYLDSRQSVLDSGIDTDGTGTKSTDPDHCYFGLEYRHLVKEVALNLKLLFSLPDLDIAQPWEPGTYLGRLLFSR